MDFFRKYRWAALLLCLLVVAGGLLASSGGLPAIRHTTPTPVKDWGTCPNGKEISSWDTGAVVPAHGVIIGHLDQPGCWAPLKDAQGSVLYQQVIRSHRYVRVRGDGFTVTKLVDRQNPEDCKKGQRYLHCLFPNHAVD